MSANNKNWNNAIRELQPVLDSYKSFCNKILAFGEAQSNEFNYASSNNFSYSQFTNHIIDLAGGDQSDDSYESDIDINHFIETREQAINELKDSVEEILTEGKVRGFGDIVKSGPSNRAEETLLNSAKIFLTPSELEESAQQNKPAADMLAKIDDGITRELTNRILVEAKKDMAAEKSAEEQKPKEYASLSDITEITGVAPKAAELAGKAMIVADTDDVSPPDATPTNPDHKPKEGPDMDFFNKH